MLHRLPLTVALRLAETASGPALDALFGKPDDDLDGYVSRTSPASYPPDYNQRRPSGSGR